MKANAEFTFYSKNQLLVFPNRSGGHSLEIYQFLDCMPKGARQYLQFVSWFLSGANHFQLPIKDATRHQWLSAIGILARGTKLYQFNLTIDKSCEICFPEHEAIYLRQIGEQEDAKE